MRCCRAGRAQQRVALLPRKALAPLEAENIDDHGDVPQPVNVIQRAEDKLAPFGDGAVAASVTELHAEQRRLVALRYVGDRTMAEIAADTASACRP